VVFGAKPRLGSSSISTSGLCQEGPANGQHLLLAARQQTRHPVPAVAEDREAFEDPSHREAARLRAPPGVLSELEVL
jgi:hypothetical protein